MKIILFVPRNYLASHYSLFSYRETLERMGHVVLECPFPGNAIHDIENIRKRMPPIEVMNTFDVIFVGFHEYVQPWLNEVYGFDKWSKLKIPVIARFDESMDRTDLGLPMRVPELKRWAQKYFFPAAQDADKFGGEWVPFGADTTIFRRDPERIKIGNRDPIETKVGTRKKYDIGFIGSLYPTRKRYLDSLTPHLPGLVVNCGNVFVQDLAGIREWESTQLLAENYRQIKVFFCFPPLSRLFVEKIFDVMAVGTLVMYPRLFGDAEKNMSIFKDGEHIVYYEHGYVVENAKQIKELLENDDKRETIAMNGSKLVNAEFTLTKMLAKMGF